MITFYGKEPVSKNIYICKYKYIFFTKGDSAVCGACHKFGMWHTLWGRRAVYEEGC